MMSGELWDSLFPLESSELMSNIAHGEWGKGLRKPICVNVNLNDLLVIEMARLKKRNPNLGLCKIRGIIYFFNFSQN